MNSRLRANKSARQIIRAFFSYQTKPEDIGQFAAK
jgi:hypothetical protein